MKPDPDVMMKFVLRVFGNQMTGGVELAWSDPVTGQISRGQMYQLDDLESLVEAARDVNRTEGVNCYIGAALRKPEGPPFGRGGDDDVLYATAYWCDLDDAEAVRTARTKCGDTPANIAVITGRHPHPRAQMWWVQEQAIEDMDLLRRQNSAIAAALGGDPSVINPGRVMRLAGSIAWPTKTGRVAELTELMTWPTRAPAYVEGEIAKSFPLDAATSTAAEGGLKVSQIFAAGSPPERWLAVIRDGAAEGERNTTATALAGHLLRRDIDVDLAAEILRLWNGVRCRPPLDDRELQNVFDSVCARELARRSVT